jgi:hypothetical protein
MYVQNIYVAINFRNKNRNNIVATQNLLWTFILTALTNEQLETVHVKFCLEIDANHTLCLEHCWMLEITPVWKVQAINDQINVDRICTTESYAQKRIAEKHNCLFIIFPNIIVYS